ncbi:MAG: methyl-accepting chemotaxis protein [Clostridium sp.]|nr:methyl-accepting chemotaxis protein [Clostridium sp.]
MKNNKGKKNFKSFTGSVRNRLIAVSIISIVLPLIILGYVCYKKSYTILQNKLIVTSGQTLQEVDRAITKFLGGLENQLEFLASSASFGKIEAAQGNVSVGKNELDMSMELLKNIKNSNENLLVAYFASSSGKMYAYPVPNLPKDYNPTEKTWYKDAVSQKGKVVWSNTYVDENTKKTIVTESKAVVVDGKVVGVMAIDIELKEMTDNIINSVIGKAGYVVLTDKNGTMIAHRDTNLLGKDTITKEQFWTSVKSKESGFEKYTYGGKQKFLTFHTNNRTGWKLMAIMEDTELVSDTDVIMKFTLLIIAICALVGIFIAILLERSISGPLNKLKEAFGKASEGDLTAKVKINSKDEFGEIGNSYNGMVDNIAVLIKEVKNSTSTVFESSKSLSDITEKTAMVSSEISRTMEEVAKGMDEEARDTQYGSEVVNELADKIEIVSKSTNNMKDISDETNKLSDNGLKAVKVLTVKSKESSVATNKVSEIISKVDKSSEEIGIITSTIEQIAQQTNLLSLNASIEAARAGEHGRGFAVVAEEVRKLSEESSKAATQIKELISGVQIQSKSAVESMDSARAIIIEQDKAVEETESIFSYISNSIKSLIDMTQELKKYSDEMAVKKDEIVNVIGNITAATEETSAATQEVSASTEEQLAAMEEVSSHTNDLSKLASELQDIVNQFRLE